MTTTPSLRWGRIVLGGFLAELLLIAAVIPMRALGSSERAITIVAVAGSFFAFVPVAWWLARPLGRPILHGVLMGTVAAALYTVLAVVGQMFGPPDLPPTPLIYYLAHVFKLFGGGTGGWLATRPAGSASGTSVGV
jgi:hypothetical protein